MTHTSADVLTQVVLAIVAVMTVTTVVAMSAAIVVMLA